MTWENQLLFCGPPCIYSYIVYRTSDYIPCIYCVEDFRLYTMYILCIRLQIICHAYIVYWTSYHIPCVYIPILCVRLHIYHVYITYIVCKTSDHIHIYIYVYIPILCIRLQIIYHVYISILCIYHVYISVRW